MASTGEVWKLGHRPALDGVRGIAILLVMACHTSVPHLFGAGPVGVTVFFTLSGFLITSLLIEEHGRSGRIDLRRFYVRRVRRLAPALLVSTAAIAAAGVVVGAGWFFAWGDVPPVLLYFGNWTLAGGGDLRALGGTWSLAVEEQFYLVWPAVVLVALRRGGSRAVGVLAGVMVVASLAVRVNLWAAGAPFVEVYYRTDTTASALAAGALLAVLLHARGPWRGNLPVVVPVGLLAGASLSIGAAVWYVSPVLATVATVALLHRGVTVPPGWLSVPVLRWFGTRSYGLYLWHIVPAWVLRDHATLAWGWQVAVVFPLAAVLAEASWRCIEQPWLKRPHLHDGRPRVTPSISHDRPAGRRLSPLERVDARCR